jgi:hypothetical protein
MTPYTETERKLFVSACEVGLRDAQPGCDLLAIVRRFKSIATMIEADIEDRPVTGHANESEAA